MARYLVFCCWLRFTVEVVGMVETHRQVPNPTPQVMASQNAR